LAYRLLERFEQTFLGAPYRHRNPQLGNYIADRLFDDLLVVDPAGTYAQRVAARSRVLNPKGRSPGVTARRGDGSFGELIPNAVPVVISGSDVAHGETANTEIGAEVKILAKSMIKQIDRVCSDLRRQAEHFRHRNPDAITVGLVGVNWAERYTSFEGDRVWTTDGGADYPHPAQEADDARRRLVAEVAGDFDELLLLDFVASNEPPFDFRWRRQTAVQSDYGAALVRLVRVYQRRFR
jgi:hypothetical protein